MSKTIKTKRRRSDASIEEGEVKPEKRLERTTTTPPRAFPSSSYDSPVRSGRYSPSTVRRERTPHSEKRVREWRDLLDGNFVLGENHEDISPKKFLIQNMRLLKDRGYDILFMEHLTQAEHQRLLDAYCNADEMQKELELYLNDLNEGHMNEDFRESTYREQKGEFNFRTIVEGAKAAGIKVVALEVDIKSYRFRHTGNQERMIHFNSQVCDVVFSEEERFLEIHGRKPKWLALVGNTHLNTYCDIPGIFEIIEGVQDISIIDAEGQAELFRSTPHKEEFAFGENKFLASNVLCCLPSSDMTYNPDLTDYVAKHLTFDEESAASAGSVDVTDAAVVESGTLLLPRRSPAVAVAEDVGIGSADRGKSR